VTVRAALRPIAGVAVALAVTGAEACAQGGGDPSTSRFEAVAVARGLETPWSLAFAPDGRLFVAERPGRIRVVAHDTLARAPWAIVPASESAAQGLETGLMGLAVDPRFARTGRVYVCYTEDSAGARTNRIAALTESRATGRGGSLTVLVPDIPAARYHDGCRLSFGPDGKLYATTGDASETRDAPSAALAQSPASLAGKVLRLDPDGAVPADNPFPGSYVWSLGHRNAQGLAWQPGGGGAGGRLFATEHGTGEGGGNELNVIERGKNYGWPDVIGVARVPRFVDPILVREDAPAGATFVTGDRYPALRGALLIATLGTQRLLAVTLGPDSAGRPSVARTEVLVAGAYGRLRDVVQGPDGYLYVATSNRDGRGRPGPDDDRVLRLLPRP
jgi:glucose/arabinose dehydrogenase